MAGGGVCGGYFTHSTAHFSYFNVLTAAGGGGVGGGGWSLNKDILIYNRVFKGSSCRGGTVDVIQMYTI